MNLILRMMEALDSTECLYTWYGLMTRTVVIWQAGKTE